MGEQLSQRMQERHLRSKTLQSILQTRDVTAKIQTRNFGNQIRKTILKLERSFFGVSNQYGRPGLVVTHFVSRFLYFLHAIFRKAVICQSFE